MKQEKIKNKKACPYCRAKRCRRGFSLLELIIAIFILTVGIAAALSLIVSTIRTSMDTRNAVIASGLAQEGVELVRNIRDDNMLYTLADLSRDPDVYFKNPANLPQGAGANNCATDVTLTGLICPGNYNIFLNTTTNTYSHVAAGGTATIFKRSISINYKTETINGNLDQLSGMDVTSAVWWSGSASAPSPCNLSGKCISVADYLPKRD